MYTSKFEEKCQLTPVCSRLIESIETIFVNTETLQKQTRADLVAMRSRRRPRRNPTDFNLVVEVRKCGL